MRRLEVGEDFVEMRDCVVEKPPGEREQGKGGKKMSKVSLINVLHALLKGSWGIVKGKKCYFFYFSSPILSLCKTGVKGEAGKKPMM